MFLAKFWNSEANRKAPEAQSQSAAALESKEIEITAARTFFPPPPRVDLSPPQRLSLGIPIKIVIKK